jgi:hypothetical protein
MRAACQTAGGVSNETGTRLEAPMSMMSWRQFRLALTLCFRSVLHSDCVALHVTARQPCLVLTTHLVFSLSTRSEGSLDRRVMRSLLSCRSMPTAARAQASAQAQTRTNKLASSRCPATHLGHGTHLETQVTRTQHPLAALSSSKLCLL